jgi:putative transposase
MHIRQYRTVYGAVEPLTGESYFSIMEKSNSDIMSEYLAGLSQKYRDDYIIHICDNAGWHKSKGLKVPENICIVHIPAGTPEMNPIEQIWKEIRKRGFRNEIFDSIDDVVKRLQETIAGLKKSTIKSITGRQWILDCF